MTGPAHHLRRAALSALALGAVMVTWSELWFYAVTDANLVVLWLMYSAVMALMLSGLAAFGVRHRDGVILGAALAGFVIEGVPVAVLYEAPPLSFVWTSLAWHATLSFGLGVVLYRRWMGQLGWPLALGLNIAIGVGLGAWNGYSWAAVEVPGGHGPIFRWDQTLPMPEQFLLGYVVWLVGHLVLDLLSQTSERPVELPRAKGYFALIGGVTLALYAIAPLPQAYPWSLAFLPLVGLCLWGMWRHGGPGPSPVLSDLLGRAIPLPRYMLTLALPASAILTITVMADQRIGFEANLFAILIAGPIGLVLTLRALASSLRRTTTP